MRRRRGDGAVGTSRSLRGGVRSRSERTGRRPRGGRRRRKRRSRRGRRSRRVGPPGGGRWPGGGRCRLRAQHGMSHGARRQRATEPPRHRRLRRGLLVQAQACGTAQWEQPPRLAAGLRLAQLRLAQLRRAQLRLTQLRLAQAQAEPRAPRQPGRGDMAAAQVQRAEQPCPHPLVLVLALPLVALRRISFTRLLPGVATGVATGGVAIPGQQPASHSAGGGARPGDRCRDWHGPLQLLLLLSLLLLLLILLLVLLVQLQLVVVVVVVLLLLPLLLPLLHAACLRCRHLRHLHRHRSRRHRRNEVAVQRQLCCSRSYAESRRCTCLGASDAREARPRGQRTQRRAARKRHGKPCRRPVYEMLGTVAAISQWAARRGGDSHAAACCLQAADPCGQSILPAPCFSNLRGWRFRHCKDEGPVNEPEVLGAQCAHAEGVGLAIGRDDGDVA